jgi:hypothetical protein
MNVFKGFVLFGIAMAVMTVVGSYDWNGRTDNEQYWYDHGYQFIDGVIEVDKVHDQDELMQECSINARLLELDMYGKKWIAMSDGCFDRAFEEDPWD